MHLPALVMAVIVVAVTIAILEIYQRKRLRILATEQQLKESARSYAQKKEQEAKQFAGEVRQKI